MNLNPGSALRPLRSVLVVAVLVGAGVACWWPVEPSPAPSAVTLQAHAGASSAPAPQLMEAASWQAGRKTTSSAEAAAAAASAQTENGSGAAAAADRAWDLCGIGRVPWPADEGEAASGSPVLPDHLMAIPLEAARAQLLAALRQGRPRAQAIAARMSREPPEQWSALALTGGDPVIALWALDSCAPRPAVTDCRQTNAANWYRLDPGNAEAVLEALAAGVLGQAEALEALRVANRAESYAGAMAAEVAATPLPGVPAYIRHALLLEAQRLDTAVLMVGGFSALGLCAKVSTPQAADRMAICSRLATLLVEHSDGILSRTLGVTLGRSAGWPPLQMARLAEESAALDAAAQKFAASRQEGSMDCASVEATQQWVTRVGRLGELGAWRALRNETLTLPSPQR